MTAIPSGVTTAARVVVIVLSAVLVSRLVAAPIGDASLVASSTNGSWQLDPSTSSATPILDGTPLGRARGVERDGSRAFFHVAPQGPDGKAGWWIVVEPPIHARGRVVRVPIGFERPSDLAWSADGKSLFFVQTASRGGADVRGAWRVGLQEPAPDAPVKRLLLSPEDASLRSLAASPDGRLAWTRLVRQDGKAQVVAVDVRDADGSVRTIVPEAFATTLAWSPDGARLAIGLQGELRVVDPSTGATTWSRTVRSFDDDLYAHHPRSIAWRPDGGALAAVIHFSGGRSAAMGEPMPVILGDREVYVVPLVPADAKPTVVALPEDVEHVSWTPASGRAGR